MRCMVYHIFLFITGIMSLVAHAVQAQTKADLIPLSVWANEAIVATYTFDAANFLIHQRDIALYFSADAWIAYSNALNDAGLPETVKKNNFTVSSVALAPPMIKPLTASMWQAAMPLLVFYQNPQLTQKQTLMVTIRFSVAPTGQGVRGFYLNSFDAKIQKPLCECVPLATDTVPKK